jgi:hypothetical protein
VYNRAVLLLWPKNSDLDLSVAIGDIYDYAFNALQSSLTDIPTKRERRLVNQLLVCCQTRRSDTKLPQAVQVLRESADRWNDVEMLLRALKACGVDKNIDLMGVEGFVSAYQAFGWDALKSLWVFRFPATLLPDGSAAMGTRCRTTSRMPGGMHSSRG